MTDKNRKEVERVFQEAASLPPGDRAAFLERECSDAAVRAEVERLLGYDDAARSEEAGLDPLLDGATVDVGPGAPIADSFVASTGDDDAEVLPANTLVSGHYRVERLLGRGGMGSVYLARDSKLERPVALKFLSAELAQDKDQRRRFLAEARAASALNHPNVCVIYQVGAL